MRRRTVRTRRRRTQLRTRRRRTRLRRRRRRRRRQRRGAQLLRSCCTLPAGALGLGQRGATRVSAHAGQPKFKILSSRIARAETRCALCSRRPDASFAFALKVEGTSKGTAAERSRIRRETTVASQGVCSDSHTAVTSVRVLRALVC